MSRDGCLTRLAPPDRVHRYYLPLLTLPRGGAEWLDRWRREDRPSTDRTARVRAWVEGLEVSPRQSPSAETSWPYPRAEGEMRTAYLIAADVFIVYAVADDGVRILYVGLHPPEDIEIRLP